MVSYRIQNEIAIKIVAFSDEFNSGLQAVVLE